ncbi:hypothetical protein BOW35_03460 [Solemya velum gill symbiont]|uniref:sulfotransferase n=1 Tax=Solemya velum gill symbiont TaxID=2340 RepID=UPI00099686F0|nr:sulfotransferase [Solemya velum gill symbiont]OOZ15770.1 hypothetical protein BOW27_02295 [Solemya velum gill symbiont]OOZ18424.1 hypothetical protein BOW28_02525 [Solemya velum gill symbiont]OOZ20866.1 hypothetical protein BOW29_00515 [Solemya velum gill symbiont]OOZ23705.1 hypothetical protein BOW30_01455 [Solemya velum gill symbiont]OOZ25249.1 hypothetical protein BOW31_02890 [Solemya velum gill symbiont]
MNNEDQVPEWLENAVLIYGPRKAGTTLLQNLHDGNNELFVYPVELKLKRFHRTIWKSQPVTTDLYFDLSLLLKKELPNFDNKSYASYVKSLRNERISSLRELIQKDIYAVYRFAENKPTNPTHWCAKEVGGDTIKIISFWRQMFLDGKVVMIVRDPLMVTRSVILDRRRKGIRLGARQIMKQTKSPMRNLYDQVQLINDMSFHFVVYEKLTADTSGTMQGVCGYLGIKYASVHEYPTLFGEKTVTSTSSRKTRKVFQSKNKWHHDLSFREKLLVWIYSTIINIGLFNKAQKEGKKYGSYPEIVKEIENRS